MKRFLVVMVLIFMGLTGMSYAEEGQGVQNATPQAVVPQAPAQPAPVADTQAPKAPQNPAVKVQAIPAPKAQAKQEALPEIVVTATKTKQQASQTPTKVEVVKSEQLKETNVMTADQGLKALPGVINNRREGTVGLTYPFAGIQLRGFPRPAQTLVLLDGQPLNNYEGNTQWWSMPVGTIDRIEMVKGPLSSLYGSGAMGGVVNIISKTDYAPLEFSLTRGSNDLTGISIASGIRIKDVTYHIAYDQKTLGPVYQINTTTTANNGQRYQNATGTGFTYENGYKSYMTEIDNLELGANWDITTDSSLAFKFINSTFSWTPEDSITYTGASNTLGNRRENSTKIYNLSYYNKVLKNVDFSVNAGLTDNYYDLFEKSPGSGESTAPNSRYNFGVQTNIMLPFANTLTVGVDDIESKVDSEDLSTTPVYQSRGKMRNAGIFLQDQWKATDFLIFYAGARYDYWKTYQGETTSSDTEDIENRKEAHVSPKLSVVVLPDSKTSIRLSAGDSFRSPTLWEIYTYRDIPRNGYGHTIPNPELDPETARNYEAGIERAMSDKLTVGATYFSNHIKDMIYQVNVPHVEADTDKTYQNYAKAYTKGYELTLNYKVSDALTVFANKTHTDTKITDADNAIVYASSIEGKEFTNVPEDLYNFGGNFKQDAFFADVLIQYVGDSYYNEDNSDIIDNAYGGNDPHTTADITVGYKFFKNCSISASILNASDVKYWEGQDLNQGRTYMVKGTASF